jgi:hypothetical protein
LGDRGEEGGRSVVWGVVELEVGGREGREIYFAEGAVLERAVQLRKEIQRAKVLRSDELTQ